MPVSRRSGTIQPGWRWGPFTARLPFYHLRLEWADLMQGMVVTAATALALVPLLQGAFGLSFEEAIACSMIHLMLIKGMYMHNPTLACITIKGVVLIRIIKRQ